MPCFWFSIYRPKMWWRTKNMRLGDILVLKHTLLFHVCGNGATPGKWELTPRGGNWGSWHIKLETGPGRLFCVKLSGGLHWKCELMCFCLTFTFTRVFTRGQEADKDIVIKYSGGTKKQIIKFWAISWAGTPSQGRSSHFADDGLATIFLTTNQYIVINLGN